jgi:hypothetical protein
VEVLTPTIYSNATEEYNGSTWSPGGNLGLQQDRVLVGFGIQTAALGFGGYAPGPTNLTEEYDGTSWSSRWKFSYMQDMV